MFTLIKRFSVLICLTLVLTSCSTESNNDIIKSMVSPNKEYLAYIFRRDMGATTEESYQLSILKKGEKLGDDIGNIYVTYGEFDIKWNSDNELIVTKVTSGESFKQIEKYDDIIIKYQ